MNLEPLLRVEQLSVGFNTDSGPIQVTKAVSFDVPRGATVGLVANLAAARA